MSDKPVMVKVAQLRPNPWNPNAMSPDIMAATIENVRRFGFNGAITVRRADEDGVYEIVDGEHRYRAALHLGIEAIPVVVREFTTAEAKAQTLAMNQLHGEMSPEQVAQLVREIEEDGIDRDELLSFSGFTAEELDGLAALLEPASEPEPEPPADDQSGGIRDGYHVLVECPDEASQLTLMARLEGEGLTCRLIVS